MENVLINGHTVGYESRVMKGTHKIYAKHGHTWLKFQTIPIIFHFILHLMWLLNLCLLYPLAKYRDKSLMPVVTARVFSAFISGPLKNKSLFLTRCLN